MRIPWLFPLIVPLASGVAHSDGMYVPPAQTAGTVAEAHTAQQHAIVAFDGQTETLVIRTAFEGNAGAFAWIVPTLGLVTRDDAEPTDATLFASLNQLTAPRQEWAPRQAAFGCSGGTGPGGGGQAVTVFDEFNVEGYQITTLGAEQSRSLVAFLRDRGYEVGPNAEAALAPYIADGWYFTAVDVDVEQAVDNEPVGGGEPIPPSIMPAPAVDPMPPLALRFEADHPVFPLRVSTASTREPVEVLVYAIAKDRMQPRTYASDEVAATPARGGQSFPEQYAREFRRHLARLGQPAFLVEYAGWLTDSTPDRLGLGGGDWFVTRLRSVLGPGDMTADLHLDAAPANRPFAVRFDAPVAQQLPSAMALPLLACCLAGLVTRGNWRRRAGRSLLVGLLVAILVL